MFEIEAMLDWIRSLPPWLGLTVLFLGALVEYVVPPFPGDTVVVAGAALVTLFDWPLWPVFVTVTTGAVVGSAAADQLGRIMRRSERYGVVRNERLRLTVLRLSQRFERHGAWLLALNRFIPGVRTFFFVAAGWVGLPRRNVLAWSALSAAIWNGMLVGLGMLVGENLPLLEQWLARYSVVVSTIIIGVLIWNGWRVWRAVG